MTPLSRRPPLSDAELEFVFKGTQRPHPLDSAAAERFLKGGAVPSLTALPAPSSLPAPPRRRGHWWAAAVGAAALVGALVVRPSAPAHPQLPSSDAYAAYGAALGNEW